MGEEIVVGIYKVCVDDYYICAELFPGFQLDSRCSGIIGGEDDLRNGSRKTVVHAETAACGDKSFNYLETVSRSCDILTWRRRGTL